MAPSPAPLFRPDLFSDPVPRFHVAKGPAAAQVGDVLHAHYPVLGKPSPNLQQSGAMELNSNNFLVEAGGGRHIVKRWPAASERASLASQAALANWLAHQRLPVPAILPARSGALVVEHAGHSWCVMAFVDRRYFSGQAEQLRHAAATIAGLFRVLEAAPAELQAQKEIRHPLQESRLLLVALERDRGRWPETFGGDHAAMLGEEWPAVQAALAGSLAMEAALRDSVRLCHIDLHPHNVLVSGDSVAAFLDFPSLARAPARSMLAFNLFKLARQAVVARGADAPPADVRRQLEGAADVAPGDLAPLAKAEIFRRLMLILQLNVASGNRAWNHVLPVMLLALHEAEALFAR